MSMFKSSSLKFYIVKHGLIFDRLSIYKAVIDIYHLWDMMDVDTIGSDPKTGQNCY